MFDHISRNEVAFYKSLYIGKVEQNTHVLSLVDKLFLVQKLYMAIVMYFAS